MKFHFLVNKIYKYNNYTKYMLLKRFLLMFVIIISASHIFSSAVVDSGLKCEVSGKISSIEFKDKYRNPCLDDSSCPVGAVVLERPERYEIEVEIDEIKTIENAGFNNCVDNYPLNTTVDVEIPTSKILNLSKIKVNNTVNVNFTRGLSNTLDSYSIINTLSTNSNTNQQQNNTNAVNNNSPNTTQQQNPINTTTSNNDDNTEPTESFFSRVLSWIQSIF